MIVDVAKDKWTPAHQQNLQTLSQMALAEDLGGEEDWTSRAIVPAKAVGAADIIARQEGVLCGLAVVETVCQEIGFKGEISFFKSDGQVVASGDRLVHLTGDVRALLTAERTMLNFLGRLSGIATQTSYYVRQVEGTRAKIFDTRKTTPGWRLLEKYGVACGGGQNHRIGLYDGILIKDNHLAFAQKAHSITSGYTLAKAVKEARKLIKERGPGMVKKSMTITIEVDTLEQLTEVLPALPDIVLLDNMTVEELKEGVALRDKIGPMVALEASGGITRKTVRGVAETGVERISIGALTHSVKNFDVALDWC
ncbi:MAG: carboxylating nicotinate-nucleotide diphosphorylase [Pirellulaceae bacterium]|nr:carboxylating nicotinate-nucleotide diphosphorylase [Pirellulaceae bacterium]